MKSKRKASSSKSVVTSLPFASYLVETRIELAKVTWPSREQVVRLSVIVIATSVVTAAYLGALDYLFVNLVRFLLNQ